MAQTALDRADKVGHCDSLAEVAAHVRDNRNAVAQTRLDAATRARDAAKALLDREAYADAVQQAQSGRTARSHGDPGNG